MTFGIFAEAVVCVNLCISIYSSIHQKDWSGKKHQFNLPDNYKSCTIKEGRKQVRQVDRLVLGNRLGCAIRKQGILSDNEEIHYR